MSGPPALNVPRRTRPCTLKPPRKGRIQPPVSTTAKMKPPLIRKMCLSAVRGEIRRWGGSYRESLQISIDRVVSSAHQFMKTGMIVFLPRCRQIDPIINTFTRRRVHSLSHPVNTRNSVAALRYPALINAHVCQTVRLPHPSSGGVHVRTLKELLFLLPTIPFKVAVFAH